MKPAAVEKNQSTPAVAVVLGLLLFLAGGALVWLLYAHASARTTASKRPSLAYSERKAFDSSGFTAVLPALPRWSDSASLAEVREAFDGAGSRDIGKIDTALESGSLAEGQQIILRLIKAALYQYDGNPKRCSQELEKTREWLANHDEVAQQWLYSVIFFQGLSALRQGENDNCILCRGESSCIVPLAAAAVHTKPAGSRAAIGYFTEYLEEFRDDIGVKWLLNVAHMTLGEFPSKVDPRYLLDLDGFLYSGPGIGKFRDVGHLLGVNRLNQAGGAIMDDFDGDRLLDIAVTTMDPTGAMALYRNRGDGTFEDRSEAAGVTGQLGGLVCYQTDYNNDGRLDVLIPRGAWLPYPVRPSLLRNDGGGKFVDVTESAGLAHSANSIAATWADYDNDGWLDLFFACEKQLNRLYHNRRDGTFEEVAAKAGVDGGKYEWKGCNWIDYDNDRFPDLFVNCMSGLSRLYPVERLSRDGRFTDVTGEMGIDGPRGGFGCWAGLGLRQRRLDRHLRHVIRPVFERRGPRIGRSQTFAGFVSPLPQQRRQGL